MQLDKKTVKQLLFIVMGGVALAAFFVKFSSVSRLALFIWRLMLPFTLGAGIAFVLNVPMRALETRVFGKAKGFLLKVRRPICLVLSLVLICLVLTALVLLIAPEMKRSFTVIADAVPAFTRRVQNWANEMSLRFPQVSDMLLTFDFDWKSLVTTAINTIKSAGQVLLTSTVGFAGSLFSGIVTAVIGFVFSIYILLQKEKLGRQVKMLLYAAMPRNRVQDILEVC